MRTSTDCTSRADECRRLAKLAAKPEDWGHFLEMAETWEVLAKQRKADEKVADEQVADEQVADKQLVDEEMIDEEMTDEEIADGEMVDEDITDEDITDEDIADEQLAAILALADGIANSRNLGQQ